MDFRKYILETDRMLSAPVTGDEFDFQINEALSIECAIVEHTDDSYTIEVDETAWNLLKEADLVSEAETCMECGMGAMYVVGESKMRCDECGYTMTMEAAPVHLMRAYDIDLHQDMGDGYWIGSDIHDSGDNRKVSYSLYKLENPIGETDKFANAWRDVGFLNVSPYRADKAQILAAAAKLKLNDMAKKATPESLGEAGFMDKIKGMLGGKPQATTGVQNQPASQAAPASPATSAAPTGAKVTYNGIAYEKAADGMWENDRGGGIPKGFPEWRAIEAEYANSGQSTAPARDPYITSQGSETLKRVFTGQPGANINKLLYPSKGSKAAVVAQFPNKKFYEITWGQGAMPIGPSKQNQAGYYIYQLDTDGKKYVKGKFYPFDLNRAMESIEEAEYQGHSVTLGKPSAGDVKKYKVYVRDPKTGNIKKVNFGDKKMSIKRDNPARRKNFRARHNCADKKDRTSAGYWSCRMWSKKPVSKILKGK
jgi:hypothetical protein